MSITIYTYHDPYSIDRETFWKDIENCPYFCAAQTLVNGLRSYYKGKFEGDRVMTVKQFIDSLYEDWESPEWMVRQHASIDNIINSTFSTELEESQQKNLNRAFLFNREEVFKSIRTLFELKVNPDAVLQEHLTKEQEYILDVYKRILMSDDKRKDFYLAESLSEEEINAALTKAMRSRHKEYDFSNVNMKTVVIHGVHQFSPIMLRAIEELQKYKRVILLFHYQKQYRKVYQTWLNIYSSFNCKIIDHECPEFTPSDSNSVSYKGNVLADQLGKLMNGQKNEIIIGEPYEIIEFDNMTEFAGYVADVFERAAHKNPEDPMKFMREYFYAADSSANDILKIYFPEQFGERQFLNYPIGHFFIAIANMWNPNNNEILISDMNDIRECLSANILSEDKPGELVSIFGRMQALFDGCTSIGQMKRRLGSVIKNRRYLEDSEEQKYVRHISYYNVAEEEIDKMRQALEDLESIAAEFYEDFEDKRHNFRDFYRRLKKYLQTNILEDRELSEEFEDILRRVLIRLNEVENIDASASFECLKSTMSIYLLQEKNPERSANWIIHDFEQIEGDILRTGRGNSESIYHFACLEDEDISAVKKPIFPWPLDNDFFEVAQKSIDWKYKVYVKCCNEYKNFKRYALIYGLEYNRAKFKLSYVKRDGVKKRKPYYLLRMLGIKKKKYVKSMIKKKLADTSGIKVENGTTGTFDIYDYYRYRICKFRFLEESIIENNTVYKDNFLLLKYMEVMLENMVKEDMQGLKISEQRLMEKLNDKFDELEMYFPFAQNANRMDVINNIRNRIMSSKIKEIPVLSKENRHYMMIRELFIHKKLENAGVDIMQDKFPDVLPEKIQSELEEKVLKDMKYTINVDEWCKYCSNRNLCTAYYCTARE